MSQSPNLSLDYIAPQQAQKHVTHNEAIRRLDALVQMSVESRAVAVAPGSPVEGAAYIVAGGASGAWTGWEGDVAAFQDGAWVRLTPTAGWRAWVRDEAALVAFNGTGWSPVGPSPDQTNSWTALQTFQAGAVIGNNITFSATNDGFRVAHGADTTATLNYDFADIAAADGQVRFFRTTNTTGQCRLDVFVGDGTATNTHRLATTGASFGVGTKTPTDKLTVAGDALFESGSVRIGAPTGGKRGAGTLNAEALYDDNALLSCYVFDQALDGDIDAAKWDAKVPARRRVSRDDETGAVLSETIEQRDHAPMRRFRKLAGGPLDPLTLEGYARHWKQRRHLPSMPDEATFDPEAGLSTGDWVQRLLETAEIQAVLIDALHERVKALEARRGGRP